MKALGAGILDYGRIYFVFVNFDDNRQLQMYVGNNPRAELWSENNAKMLACWDMASRRMIACQPPMAALLFADYWQVALDRCTEVLTTLKSLGQKPQAPWAEATRHFIGTDDHIAALRRA